MTGCLKGCLGRVLGLVALVVAGAAAWWYAPPEWRAGLDKVRTRVVQFAGGSAEAESADTAQAEVTPELAEATLDRVAEFGASADPDDELVLGSAEVSSVARHSFPGTLPAGLTDPAVAMSDGRLVLSAAVTLDALPEIPALDDVAGLLPDTVPVEVGGSLEPGDGSSVRFNVDEVRAARIPLPDRVIPRILEVLGREGGEGLPPAAMPLPLPPGIRDAWVRRDSLVLVAGS